MRVSRFRFPYINSWEDPSAEGMRRRRVLSLLAGGATVWFAGCTEGDLDDSTESPTNFQSDENSTESSPDTQPKDNDSTPTPTVNTTSTNQPTKQSDYGGSDSGGNPILRIEYSPVTPRVGEEVTFSAESSRPREELIVNWDLDGDGEFDDGKGNRITTTYHEPGVVQVAMMVTDTRNGSVSILKSSIKIEG
jgi:hypothetical protein